MIAVCTQVACFGLFAHKPDVRMDGLDLHINIQSLHYMHVNVGCQHVWAGKACMQACMHCVECCCVAQNLN
jgi:hypothetical protein